MGIPWGVRRGRCGCHRNEESIQMTVDHIDLSFLIQFIISIFDMHFEGSS